MKVCTSKEKCGAFETVSFQGLPHGEDSKNLTQSFIYPKKLFILFDCSPRKSKEN